MKIVPAVHPCIAAMPHKRIKKIYGNPLDCPDKFKDTPDAGCYNHMTMT